MLTQLDLSRPAVRFGLFYAALMVLPGIHLIYLGIWLDWRGLTATDIAAIGSVPILARVILSPLIGFWADRSGQHLYVMRWLAALTVVATIGMVASRSFAPILIWHAIGVVLWSTLLALGETVTLAASTAQGTREAVNYGRVRLWGSISFVIAGALAGLIGSRFGAGGGMALSIVGAILTVWAVWKLPSAAPPTASEQRRRPSVAQAIALLKSKVFLLFLAAAGLTNAGHAVLYTFGTLHWQSLGYATVWGSIFWLVSIAVEVWLFWQTALINQRVTPLILIGLGAVGGALRWFAMGFDPPLFAVLLLQVLHGLTYGATHIGAMQVLNRLVVPEMAATAQTVYATLALGVLMAIAVRLGGTAYASYGSGAYWVMAVTSLLGGLATLALLQRLGRTLPDRPIIGVSS